MRQASLSSHAEKNATSNVAGQGTGQIKDVPTTEELVARLRAEYEAAKARIAA